MPQSRRLDHISDDTAGGADIYRSNETQQQLDEQLNNELQAYIDRETKTIRRRRRRAKKKQPSLTSTKRRTAEESAQEEPFKLGSWRPKTYTRPEAERKRPQKLAEIPILRDQLERPKLHNDDKNSAQNDTMHHSKLFSVPARKRAAKLPVSNLPITMQSQDLPSFES